MGMTECYAIFQRDYEGIAIVSVYEARSDADEMLARVKEYVAKAERPRCPNIDVEFDDAVWEAYQTLEDAWTDAHPLGRSWGYYGDDFHVAAYPYIARTPDTGDGHE